MLTLLFATFLPILPWHAEKVCDNAVLSTNNDVCHYVDSSILVSKSHSSLCIYYSGYKVQPTKACHHHLTQRPHQHHRDVLAEDADMSAKAFVSVTLYPE